MISNVAPYSHKFFHNLQDSNNMWGLADVHKDELHALGNIICRYDMEHLVGVSLVHRHHKLSKDEKLVWDLNDNIWQAEPRIINESVLIPVNWGVGLMHGKPCLYPIEFCTLDQKHNSELLLSREVLASKDFVSDFSEAVRKLHVHNLFGLSLLQVREHFNRENFTVFEQSNLSKRITKAWVVPKNDLENNSGGVTLWNFTKNHQINSVRGCASGNSRHCCDNSVELH